MVISPLVQHVDDMEEERCTYSEPSSFILLMARLTVMLTAALLILSVRAASSKLRSKQQ
jgi:hypothetical protein